jgi:outer membrane autotransporter protein
MRVGLSGGIDYDDTSCGKTCLIAGASEDISKWLAKGAVRLDAAFSNGRILPYAEVSLSDDLSDGNRVAVGNAFVETDMASSLFGAEAGVTALVDDRVALFINAGVVEGLSNDVSGFNGQGGFKLYW